MQKYTDTQIIKELRRVFRANNSKPYSRRDYESLGAISKTTVEKRFGTWSQALDEAGLASRFAKARKKTRF
jgi:hypothetical protein